MAKYDKAKSWFGKAKTPKGAKKEFYTQEREFSWADVGPYWHCIYHLVRWQQEWEKQRDCRTLEAGIRASARWRPAAQWVGNIGAATAAPPPPDIVAEANAQTTYFRSNYRMVGAEPGFVPERDIHVERMRPGQFIQVDEPGQLTRVDIERRLQGRGPLPPAETFEAIRNLQAETWGQRRLETERRIARERDRMIDDMQRRPVGFEVSRTFNNTTGTFELVIPELTDDVEDPE